MSDPDCKAIHDVEFNTKENGKDEEKDALGHQTKNKGKEDGPVEESDA